MFLKQYNKYIFYDDYVVGITNKGYLFTFDEQFYDLVKDYCWECSDKYGYYITAKRLDNHNTIKLHRLICGLTDSKDIKTVIDHKDHNPLNNRLSNLRICTNDINCKNQRKPINSKCPFMGVSWCNNRYASRIGVNGKKIHLGSYINLDDAIRARLKAEKEYFGEFSPQKDLFEKYGI